MEFFGLDSGMFAFCVFSFLAGAYIVMHGIRSRTETKLFKGACVVLGSAYMAVTISTVTQLDGIKAYFGVEVATDKAEAEKK